MSKILVIDDDKAFRDVLTTMLQKQGLDVVQAATGAEGVQLARTGPPNLILCDVELGGVGGQLVLYAVRRDPQLASIPFILMSGHGMGGEIAMPGVQRGADGFLSKPIAPGKLAATLDACLHKAPPVRVQANSEAGEQRLEAWTDSSPGLLEPLNRILEITRLLSTAPKEPKAVIDMAGQAHLTAARLYRRIENCLAYAEIERLATDWEGLGALQERRTDIRDATQSVAREMARLMGRSADLVLTLQDAVVAISADRLKKIVAELVDNAFRYSQPGSAVEVTAATEADGVTLEIRDQGAGMTTEQIARAGTPLPLDQVLLTQHGSGLGLPVARRLTELHHGNMTIQGGTGQGTVITLHFPGSARV